MSKLIWSCPRCWGKHDLIDCDQEQLDTKTPHDFVSVSGDDGPCVVCGLSLPLAMAALVEDAVAVSDDEE